MKISGGLQQDGIVVGNAFDKYGSQNPIVRWLMKGFNESLTELLSRAKPQTIHEVGCGEGFLTLAWKKQGLDAVGSDFSSRVVEIARSNAVEQGVCADIFKAVSIYELQPGVDAADLIVCCEVLEHLENPTEALQTLQNITRDYLILSVPREPVWRILNMLRGKYLSFFGNTPGHIQHWSSHSFIKFASQFFEIVEVRTPLPWTMLLCRTRS